MNGAVVSRYPAGWSIAMGVLLVLFGLLAIALPMFAGIAVSLVFGWLILLGGVTHLTYAWFERRGGAILWQLLIGIAYLLAGFWILLHPASGVAALAFIFAFYIAAEGVFELGVFVALRSVPGRSWFLVDGIISLLLAALILSGWPSNSAWAIGTLVGISFLMSGIARLTMPARRHRLAPQV